MKNLKMSTKLLVCFMSICLLMVVLGSAAYTVVRAGAKETSDNLETHLPAIARANEATVHALVMVAEMRAFAAKGKAEDFVSARNMLVSAKEAANTAADASVKMDTELLGSFRGFVDLLNTYESGMVETSSSMSLINAERLEMAGIITVFENDLAELRNADSQSTSASGIRTSDWWRAFARSQRATREKFRAGEFRNDTALLLQAVQETEDEITQLQSTGAEITDAMNDYRSGISRIQATTVGFMEVDEARSKLGDEIIESCMEISRQELSALENSGDKIASRLNSVSQFLVIGLIFCVLLSVLVSVFLARAISRPLEAAARFATSIAGGDYTQKIQDDRKDEIGDLGRALNSVSTALQDSVSSMLEGVNVLSSSVSEIISSTSELAASASETAASVSETSATVEEVKQTGVLSNEKSQYVAQAGRASAQSLRDGERAAEQLTTGMDHIRAQTESVAAAIDRLAEHSRLIGEIITSVDEIAEQSNILAVNAAIEAAKAGEQGRGFAVVAREIRSLSEQSKRSTSRVRGILAQIESGTAEAVRAVDRGNEAVEQGRNHTRLASQSIQDMREVIRSTSEASAQIAVMSQQQVIGMDQATLAMSSIKQASHQTAESMKQLESAAQSLRDLGERLRDLAAR